MKHIWKSILLKTAAAVLPVLVLLNGPSFRNSTAKPETAPSPAVTALPEDSANPMPTAEPGTEERSGPVSDLPWEGDEGFLAKQHEAGAPVLMGAYRAVLHDPLPGEEYNVHLAAGMLAGRVVPPGAVFSQNLSIGPYTASRGFRIGPTYIGTTLTTTIGGGVCKIASTLYNVTVLSNLSVVERHCHSMPVPYVPYGQDATVAYGSRDFKFKNDSPFPVMIWAQGIDNKLYIAFYGSEPPPAVEWVHEVSNVRKAATVYKKNPGLMPGEEKVILEGMDGATVKSKVRITYADGMVAEKKMGPSNYQAMPSLVERGD